MWVKRFCVAAHVTQGWLVDENGDWQYMKLRELNNVMEHSMMFHVMDAKVEKDYGYFLARTDLGEIEDKEVCYIARDEDYYNSKTTLIFVK